MLLSCSDGTPLSGALRQMTKNTADGQAPSSNSLLHLSGIMNLSGMATILVNRYESSCGTSSSYTHSVAPDPLVAIDSSKDGWITANHVHEVGCPVQRGTRMSDLVFRCRCFQQSHSLYACCCQQKVCKHYSIQYSTSCLSSLCQQLRWGSVI